MDGSLIDSIALLAAVGLGLSAGGLLAEGAVMVPFWRSIGPEEFLRWYERNASRLLRFFGPLEAVPAVLVIATAAASLYGDRPGSALWVLSGLLAIGALLSFPLYFCAANENFATDTTRRGGGERRAPSWVFVALGADLRRDRRYRCGPFGGEQPWFLRLMGGCPAGSGLRRMGVEVDVT